MKKLFLLIFLLIPSICFGIQDSVIRPTNTTASRLVSTDTDKKLISVTNLCNWVYGTALEIECTDNLDGTATIGIVTSPTLDGTNFSGIPDGALVETYFLLAGRAGGQVGYGGTLTGEDLTLHSNLLNDGSIFLGSYFEHDEATGSTILSSDSVAVAVKLDATRDIFDKNVGEEVSEVTITSVDSPYALPATVNFIDCDTDGGAIEIDFTAGTGGRYVAVNNTGSAGNDCTLDPNGVETMLGQGAGVAIALHDGEEVDLRWTSTNYWR